MIGISVDTLNNYKKLTELIPELEELVDTGILAPTTALAYKTKEEVMEWMLDIQLGRRNLSPIQRIAIAEKYRSIYEKQARENSLNNLKQNQLSEKSNLTNRDNNKSTNDKLAEIANVKPTTYKMGAKILDSDDENSKLRALISNNFGRRKNNPEKDRKALVMYVELKGYRNGEIGRNHFQTSRNENSEKLTLDEIAKELNISKSNLTRALSIERNLTDSMIPILQTNFNVTSK